MVVRCLHITASLDANTGGPARSVTTLCDALAVAGAKVYLVTQQRQGEASSALILPGDHKVQLHMVPAFTLGRSRFSPNLYGLLRDYVIRHQIDLIHSHGLWLQCNYIAHRVAEACHLPHVISPRGMLEPWAFRHRYWKKWPIWHLWQRGALERSALLCATSSQEAEGVRRQGLRAPVSVIPNGVALPDIDQPLTEPGNALKIALFLGRIHPVKGLADLVEAWNQLRPAGWRCVIAGPDEQGYAATIRQMICKMGLQDSFTWVGTVTEENKSQIFYNADVFVLPTQSENFGLVIAEALAHQVPVITTRGAPWQSIFEKKCGWWIDLGVDPLVGALREAFAMPRRELQAMGLRGRQLVSEEFSCQHTGEAMHENYQRVLEVSQQSACVRYS